MIIEPIEAVNVSKATVNHLLSMIKDGYWKAGDCLPPQRELAKLLGIGMSSLREALQSLHAMGILEMHQGKGTFVAPRPYISIERIFGLSLALGDIDMKSLLEARMVVERGLAYHAAKRASEDQIITLFEILDEQENALRNGMMDKVDELDLSFHHLIASMANNVFLQQIDDMLSNALERLFRNIPHTIEGLRLHRAVADAICARDQVASSQAVKLLIHKTASVYFPDLQITEA